MTTTLRSGDLDVLRRNVDGREPARGSLDRYSSPARSSSNHRQIASAASSPESSCQK
jgi:hypothetical protein